MYIMLRSEILKTKYLIFFNIATNASLNAKINEIKGKLPITTNLATTSALNSKINDVKVRAPCFS